jgi:hypothetical protein
MRLRQGQPAIQALRAGPLPRRALPAVLAERRDLVDDMAVPADAADFHAAMLPASGLVR